jgi:hypothetical protein
MDPVVSFTEAPELHHFLQTEKLSLDEEDYFGHFIDGTLNDGSLSSSLTNSYATNYDLFNQQPLEAPVPQMVPSGMISFNVGTLPVSTKNLAVDQADDHSEPSHGLVQMNDICISNKSAASLSLSSGGSSVSSNTTSADLASSIVLLPKKRETKKERIMRVRDKRDKQTKEIRAELERLGYNDKKVGESDIKRIKNNLAARASRKRKRGKVDELSDTVKSLEQRCLNLEHQLEDQKKITAQLNAIVKDFMLKTA